MIVLPPLPPLKDMRMDDYKFLCHCRNQARKYTNKPRIAKGFVFQFKHYYRQVMYNAV